MISLLFSNQLLRKIEWYPDCSGRDRNPIQKRVHFFYLIHIVVSCHQYWWICIWRTNCVTQLLVLTVRSKIDIRNCIQLILLICNLNRPLWFKTYNCANIVIVNLYQCIINHIFCAVHFWAPAFKWGISIANIADFTKPPEKISYPQQIGMHMHIELHVVLCYLLRTSLCLTDARARYCSIFTLVKMCISGISARSRHVQVNEYTEWWVLVLQPDFSIYSRVWHLCVADYFCFYHSCHGYRTYLVALQHSNHTSKFYFQRQIVFS
jgi:hypothetical protein